ncbi:hypothetical protein ABFX02_12G141600 [Erythranthe guttata]
MQTAKSRPGSIDVPLKPSPTTPRTVRKLKTPGSDSDSFSSPNPVSKTPKTRSPKIVDRRSPQSASTEKKRPNRVPELESKLAHLQEELKKVKDQLISSESQKTRANQEAEDAKKQLNSMLAKLEETQKQLNELTDSDESRVQELRKISQDRDREWQSELDAVKKHHSIDSSALASALNEIQRLKVQLDRVSESEAAQAKRAESAHTEIRSLKVELTEALELVEKLRNQINSSRESESGAVEEVSRAQMLLEVLKNTEETLHSEYDNAVESHTSLFVELEQSKNRVDSLEELVSRLKADLASSGKTSANPSNELNHLKTEANQLRGALELAERRYQDQYLQSTLQIRDAYESVKHVETESCQREAELEAKLQESKAEVDEFRAKLIEKENALQNPNMKENELEIELKKSDSVLEDLKASLLDKETKLQSIAEENERLKLEIAKREIERNKLNDEAIASEREALMKLGYLTEEADKSCRKAIRFNEELDAAQAVNLEMEAELRKLKVQSDQWRKAAEAAASMLSSNGNNNNGKYVERTGSLNYHTIGGKLGAPYAEDTDDDSPKKKNGSMLKKIGVLLKKGQK